MTEYKPLYRRPIADMFRKTAQSAVQLCVRWGVHPDAISYLSIVMSAIAAVLFLYGKSFPAFLLIAPFFCYVRLWFNMLDGMVALASGKASLRGEILNDLPDRISDVLIFVGVAHCGLNQPWLGYWGAIGALLVAYVGVFGQAVGVQREFSGIMSKPWRMVVLHLGAWITCFMIIAGQGDSHFMGLTVMDWALIVILAGCIQTIAIRLNRIMAALRRKARSGQER